LEKQNKEEMQLDAIRTSGYNLNSRQIQLLNYLHKNPKAFTTITSHINIYGISPATAVKDLQQLLRKGFLVNQKQDRHVLYTATNKINKLFN
jgi:Fic family protein